MDSASYPFLHTLELLLKYIGITALIFSTVLTLFCCCCWIYRLSYSNLPSLSLEPTYMYLAAMGRIPKNISFTSYFLNKIIEDCRSNEKEGLILLWGFRPMLFIFDEYYIKIFANETAAVNKPSFAYNVLGEVVGNGLLTINGVSWKHHRKMFNPAFRFEMLKSYLPIFNRRAKMIVKELSKVCNGPTVEVIDILKIESLKLLCESVLGIKLKDEEYNEKIQKYLKLLTSLGEYTIYRFPRPWLQWKWLQILFPSGRQHWRIFKEFQAFTKDIILDIKASVPDQVLRNPGNGPEDTYFNAKSFTQILLECQEKDPSFTMEDVLAEVNNITLAGHDTTAHTMLWCLFMLGHHPEIQEKAFQEAEFVIGNDTNFSYSNLSELIYLESIIKETLRLYPTVPMHGRKLSKQLKCGKYVVPKNTVIVFVPFLLHKNPNIYPDPEKFDPERFSKDAPKHPWSYVPFSEGIRSCIGKKFAMMEMKIILAHILRNFRIMSLDKREDIGLNWDLVLTPSRPIRFYLTSRQSSSLPRG